jgi:hypothetical protein
VFAASSSAARASRTLAAVVLFRELFLAFDRLQRGEQADLLFAELFRRAL